MPKRKFQEISSSASTASVKLNSSQRHQQERLLGYLENGQTQLLGALKLARGFERQKLGRRQKDATNKNKQGGDRKDAERIEEEIKALKALDLTAAAEFYVARTLCKIKTIASSPVIPKELIQKGTAPSPYREPAVANVTARIFKSTAVRNAMESIQKEVRQIVAVSEQDSKQSQVIEQEHKGVASIGGTGYQAIPAEHSDVEGKDNVKGPGSTKAAQILLPVDSDESSGDDIGNDYDIYDDRLASSSESELDPEIEERELVGANEVSSESQSDGRSEASISTPASISPRPAKSNRSVSKADIRNSKPTTKTTFLPTLASGYISGSDPESFASDAEQSTEKPKRKNRMGQQARRALAEAKYGAAANHLKNQNGKKNKGRGARDTGWDLKKGAINGRNKGGSSSTRHFKSELVPSPNIASKARTLKPRTRDDTGDLHPSWIAKKKMKEQQSQGTAFKGKKMVFD